MQIAEIERQLRAGQSQGLAKALTLIESRRHADRRKALHLLSVFYDSSRQSHRIGVSGSPGVGKSTFIEELGQHFLRQGHRLAVLTIDPSSPRSFGSILGDKTRMERLAQHPHCFIRPSPSGLNWGGVAKRTREAILICEAAGYDTIIVETVGVGQTEALVGSMVDEFIFLQLPNAGDQLQGLKKGILELADMLIVTKADGELKLAAEKARLDYGSALHFMQPDSERLNVPVMVCSALTGAGIAEIYALLIARMKEALALGIFEKRRQRQGEAWFESELQEQLIEWLLSKSQDNLDIENIRQGVAKGKKAPPVAADEILSYLKKAEKVDV